MIYVSRFISGILFGIFLANIYVYLAETAHPDMRGMLAALPSVMEALGYIFTYAIGYGIQNWRLVAWFELIAPVLLGVSAIFLPESPFWLVERGRDKEAYQSLRKLRGPDYDVQPELDE